MGLWDEFSKVNPGRDVPTTNKFRDGSWADVPIKELNVQTLNVEIINIKKTDDTNS